MRVTALLLVLAATLVGGAAACKGDSSAAVVAVVPGAPAGDVTEVSGDVHATRDGKARAIAKGDVVSGDDVIATGADGRVTIVLRHNQVAWALGPGKEKKVGDSAAWAAAKGAAAEEATDDKSAAAGRHAERTAADTAASTGAAGGSSVSAGSGSGSAEVAAQEIANAQDDADRRAAADRLAALQKSKVDMEERIAAAKADADKSERRKGVRISEECLNNPLAKGCDGGDSTEGAADAATLGRELRAHAGDFRACYEKLLETSSAAAGGIVVHVRIGANGKPTAVDVTGDDALAGMRGCVKTAVRAISFSAPGGEINITYPLRFQPD